MTEIANVGAGEQQPELQSQKSFTSIKGEKVNDRQFTHIRLLSRMTERICTIRRKIRIITRSPPNLLTLTLTLSSPPNPPNPSLTLKSLGGEPLHQSLITHIKLITVFKQHAVNKIPIAQLTRDDT